jgi:GNAT superfamily N-acetyltransferase
MMRPPDLPEDHKVVYGVRDGADALVGLVDVLRGHPDPETAYVGLLQVRGDRQGEGLGRAAHAALLDVLRDWPEIRTIRLAVVATNREVADPFWRSLGYQPVGDPVPYRYADLETTAQRYERALDEG